ncbi:hypothetical protein [Algoriphagus resistens]|uniref:hypothetical protein n=1 Tax=Algoriphagus resistens TaxID=1750590 RepID=UPI0007168193|nr:hypothetical protein [Algoriphagus resistens]
MSEFKLVGDKYITQWNGSSINDGSEETPYAHPADAPSSSTNKIIIGSGYYNGVWTGYRRLIGDGKVVIDLNGGNFNGGSLGSYTNPTHENIKLLRCDNLCGLGTAQDFFINDSYLQFTFISTGYRLGGNFVRCIFEGYLTDNIVRVLVSSQNNGFSVNNCIFLSSIEFPWERLTQAYNHCYLPLGKTLTISSLPTTTQINNSMINGYVRYLGVDYELKKLYDGSVRPDANPAIPDLVDVYTTIYTSGNFAGDPKFIDIENKLVEPDSDLLKRSSTYGFIGGVKPARYIGVNSISSDVTIETARIDNTNPSNYIIESGENDGEVIITYKTDTITEVQAIFIDSLLAFDGSEVGGTVGNNNVPDIFPTSYIPLSTPGLKPNRLLYAFRTSQSIAKPTLESQWDNDSVSLGTTPGAWYIMEWNIKPTIHGSMGNYYGNGNPESIGIAGNGMNARWRQVKIRLTNLRSYV